MLVLIDINQYHINAGALRDASEVVRGGELTFGTFFTLGLVIVGATIGTRSTPRQQIRARLSCSLPGGH